MPGLSVDAAEYALSQGGSTMNDQLISTKPTSRLGCLDVDSTTTIDRDDAKFEAALCLRSIAAGYRKFAEEAGNSTIWESRLRLAAKFDREAAALAAASNQPCRG
jgi:hypothetical protein